MAEETFKEYWSRKWPKYCEAVMDYAVELVVSWKLGDISAEERDWELDKLLTPESKKKLIDIANSIPN